MEVMGYMNNCLAIHSIRPIASFCIAVNEAGPVHRHSVVMQKIRDSCTAQYTTLWCRSPTQQRANGALAVILMVVRG